MTQPDLRRSLITAAFIALGMANGIAAACAGPKALEYNSTDKSQKVVFREVPTIWMTIYSGDTYQLFPVTECTDRQLFCKAAGFLVFAIPRNQFVIGSSYDKGGVRFSISKCLRYSKGRCREVVVKAVCAPSELSECSRAISGNRRWDKSVWTHFIYDDVLGVRSFGYTFANEEPTNDGELARQFVAPKGALALTSMIPQIP